MIRSETLWHGHPAIAYETSDVRLVVVPDRGGKLVSLQGADSREWLISAPEGPDYGSFSSFIEAEMCGWDECAPTIEPCALPSGAAMADHGDLWNQRWQWDGAGDRLTARLPSVDADIFREISVTPEGRIRFDYEVGAGSLGFPFLWAAHPQFAVGAEDEVSVAGAVRDLWDVGNGAVQPQPGERLPRAFSLAELPVGGHRKLYLDPSDRVGGAAIQRADGGRLVMTWDPALLPYLGIWFDRAAFAREDTIAIEPCTGWYDSVRRAADGHRVVQLEPGQSFRWWLELALEPGEGFSES